MLHSPAVSFLEMFRCCSCFSYARLATRRVYKTGLLGPTPCQRLSTNFQPTSNNSSFIVSFSMCFLISKPASIANLISHWDGHIGKSDRDLLLDNSTFRLQALVEYMYPENRVSFNLGCSK